MQPDDRDWQSQSDMIVQAINIAAAESFSEAEKIVSVMFLRDTSVSRRAISDALKRLKEIYG